MAVETHETSWPNFPKAFYVSVPIDQIELPKGVEVPEYAKYWYSAVYLGPGNDRRHFWEDRRAEPVPVGTEVSYDGYLEELDRHSVPLPPKESTWSKPITLWTANLHTQTEVSFLGADASQARVTSTARSIPPEGPHKTLLFWNQTSDELAKLGLGETDFDTWREDGRFLRERSKILQKPFIGPLVRRILTPVNTGFHIMDMQSNPEGYMINSVRTRRS